MRLTASPLSTFKYFLRHMRVSSRQWDESDRSITSEQRWKSLLLSLLQIQPSSRCMLLLLLCETITRTFPLFLLFLLLFVMITKEQKNEFAESPCPFLYLSFHFTLHPRLVKMASPPQRIKFKKERKGIMQLL